MKNILLVKIKTLKEANYPQEEKYPSGTVVAKGHMWKWTEPEVNKMFYVMYSKLTPVFRTSYITEIISKSKNEIIFKTQNSIYKVIIIK